MTFGEKLQKLRKEAGMSQEELAFQLGVSRQAVSKWERDGGYPETEKLIRMSRLFQVTLDAMLNEDETKEKEQKKNEPKENREKEEKPAAGSRIYVNREKADGFFLYQKRKLLKTAAAAGILVGSLAFVYIFERFSDLFFMLAVILGLLLLFSVKLTENPYKRLWKESFLLDKEVKEEWTENYAGKKKRLQFLELTGIGLIAFGIFFCPLLIPAEIFWADAIALSAGMLAAAAGTFLCVYVSGVIRAYRLLVFEGDGEEKEA